MRRGGATLDAAIGLALIVVLVIAWVLVDMTRPATTLHIVNQALEAQRRLDEETVLLVDASSPPNITVRNIGSVATPLLWVLIIDQSKNVSVWNASDLCTSCPPNMVLRPSATAVLTLPPSYTNATNITVCVLAMYGSLFCNATLPVKVLYRLAPVGVYPIEKFFSVDPDYVEYPISFFTNGSWDAYLYYKVYYLNAWQLTANSRDEDVRPIVLPSEVPLTVKQGSVDARYTVIPVSVRSPWIDYYPLFGECWYRFQSTPVVVVENGTTRSPHYIAVWTGSGWVITSYDTKVSAGTPLILVVDGLPLYLGICGGPRASETWVNCTVYLAYVTNGTNSIAAATSYCYTRPGWIMSALYNTSNTTLAIQSIVSSFGDVLPPPSRGLELDFVTNLNLTQPPAVDRAKLYIFTVESDGWVLRYTLDVDLLNLTIGLGNAFLLDLYIRDPVVHFRYSTTTYDIIELDAESAIARDMVILGIDRENRYDIAVIHPLQIYVSSAREGAGIAEPGNLTLSITWEANVTYYTSGSYQGNVTIDENRSWNLDLDIPVAIGQNELARTIIKYVANQTIVFAHNITVPIETRFKFVTDIEYDTTPPAQPPTTAPVNNYFIAKQQPQIVVLQQPIPTNNTPINTVITVKVYQSNINASEWTLRYTLYSITKDITVVDETISFVQKGSNLAEASFTVPGNDYYTIYVWVVFSRHRWSKKGRPRVIGRVSYQPSKKRYVVLCFDPECDNYFRNYR